MLVNCTYTFICHISNSFEVLRANSFSVLQRNEFHIFYGMFNEENCNKVPYAVQAWSRSLHCLLKNALKECSLWLLLSFCTILNYHCVPQYIYRKDRSGILVIKLENKKKNVSLTAFCQKHCRSSCRGIFYSANFQTSKYYFYQCQKALNFTIALVHNL